jgi:hypothetical protein
MQDYWSKYSPAPMPGTAAQQGRSAYKQTPDDAKTLTDMAHAIPQARLLAQRAQEAMKVQGTGASAIPTGPALSKWDVFGMDLNPVRAAITLAGAVNPQAADLSNRLQRLDQINSETFANIRPDGSGRIMQSEVKPFKQAFPATGSYGTNNQSSAKQFQDEYADKLAQYQFVSNYVHNGHGSAADGLVAYDGMKKAAQQPGPAPQQQRNPAPTQAAPAQQGQAPSGAVYDVFGRQVQQ